MSAQLKQHPVSQDVESLFSLRPRAWLLFLLLIVAAAIRIRAALNDLWLDEIWSLINVRNISSPLAVFTGIHLDNNHYLNSLWLYAFRDHGNWAGFRLPSVVAGVGCVLMAGLIGRRHSARAGFIAMFLVSFSYVQILYSSEARGYSEVVFFSFLSFYALEQFMEKADWLHAAIFSVSSILGFAANLLFLDFYCAALVWSGWRFRKSGFASAQFARSMLACHAAPLSFFAMLYWVDVSHLIVGGGTPSSLGGTYASSLAWPFGAAPGGLITVATGLLTLALFLAALWLLCCQHSDAGIFFIGVIAVFPILLILVHQSDAIYVRHFIIGMAFLLIAFSFALAALYEHGRQGRLVCLTLMAAYFVLNGSDTIAVFNNGRGQYSDALRFLVQNTKGPDITIGSDHDFRVSLVLQFYSEDVTGDKTVKYYPLNSWPHAGPEWVIHHMESFENPSTAQTRITDGAGNRYDLVRSYRTAPLSGLHWFIYHNDASNLPN